MPKGPGTILQIGRELGIGASTAHLLYAQAQNVPGEAVETPKEAFKKSWEPLAGVSEGPPWAFVGGGERVKTSQPLY